MKVKSNRQKLAALINKCKSLIEKALFEQIQLMICQLTQTLIMISFMGLLLLESVIRSLNLERQPHLSAKWTLARPTRCRSRLLISHIQSNENPWCQNQRSSCLVFRRQHLLKTIRLLESLSIARLRAHLWQMFWSVPRLQRVVRSPRSDEDN